jgi:hypothetical protein
MSVVKDPLAGSSVVATCGTDPLGQVVGAYQIATRAMSLSSISFVVNVLQLRRVDQ